MSGDTISLGVSHPDFGARELSVQSDQSVVFGKGGYEGERQHNGNGTGHKKMKRVGWSLEGLQIDINMKNKDLEYCQDISNSPVDAVFTWEHIDGYIYTMTGSIEGEVKMDSNTGYLPLALSGNGIAEPIA